MSMQDPISACLAVINNAQARLKPDTKVPSSTKKIALLEVLKKEGYIDSFEISDKKKSNLKIKLKYLNGKPVIKELKRISKPGLRQYVRRQDIPIINGGLGISIISTSKGLMTDREAREAGLGGEVICSVF